MSIGRLGSRSPAVAEISLWAVKMAAPDSHRAEWDLCSASCHLVSGTLLKKSPAGPQRACQQKQQM